MPMPRIQRTEEIKSEIQGYVKTRLSIHEYSKEIEFVSKLPDTPDGKLERKELKAREYKRKMKT